MYGKLLWGQVTGQTLGTRQSIKGSRPQSVNQYQVVLVVVLPLRRAKDSAWVLHAALGTSQLINDALRTCARGPDDQGGLAT